MILELYHNWNLSTKSNQVDTSINSILVMEPSTNILPPFSKINNEEKNTYLITLLYLCF